MPVDGDALQQWSQLHDGYDVGRSRLVRSWLTVVHVLARPLTAAGIRPTTVTVAGVATATAATVVRGPAAAGLVVATALCDGLDGAVALQRGAPSRHGTLIDHTADRLTDLLFAGALRRAGAPRKLAACALAATLAYETARSALRRHGRDVTIVTVGERPMRVVIVACGTLAGPSWAAAGLAVLGVGGMAQLATAARHRSGRVAMMT